MDKIKEVVSKIEPINENIGVKIQAKLDNLTKPLGSLGKLEQLAKKIGMIKNTITPNVENKYIFVFAADHGVCEEKISAYPQEVTQQMVYNFLNGGAGINVLARQINAKVIVIDIGVKKKIITESKNFIDRKINFGTKNMKKEPAMTKKEATSSIEVGIEIVESMKDKIDIAGVGDMGIGNTTPASAITSVLTGCKVEDCTGRGTGIDEQTYKRKIEVIKEAIKRNNVDKDDPIDVLSKVGGFEIGGIAGVILSCAKNRIPVVIDGFISSCGALIAYEINKKVKDYIIPSHISVEKGHRIILEHIGLEGLFDLNMRLGEGTGACIGIFLCECGVKILNEMATFEQAGVSKKIL
ncbi:MAG: nicotinate-nucleotide--dimethylbenzimidazole phosphoribosyltransferase [Candidatus Omnitrophica bacterium]|nr:nicotinate-nucleotide--dimethylbenzimidazole phosphoribosyltransferase [Candidatus Omnitrophota bacterium]